MTMKQAGMVAAAFWLGCTALAAAEPPARPAPIFGVFVGHTRAALDQYEQWNGKPADAVLTYTGDKSWEDFDGSVGWNIGLWKDSGRRILWSVSLIPKTATLAEAATGAYNDHYLKAARAIARTTPGDDVIYIRTGWEFNGDWFHYRAQGQTENFIGAWRQFVTTFRSASPRFRFDWCPAAGKQQMDDPEKAYPGDDYVDVIGLDVYDEMRWMKIADPQQRWDRLFLNGKTGLKWHQAFARAHGKPMSYPEWGTGGNQSGDDPLFVEKMHQWILDNPVVYATYWNSESSYRGTLSHDKYPNAGRIYRALFGNGDRPGRESVPAPTPVPPSPPDATR